jgi:hypothetical protein
VPRAPRRSPWQPGAPRFGPIVAAPSGVAAVLGPLPAGPIEQPAAIGSVAELDGAFGTTGASADGGSTRRALEAYFANGGSRAIVVRTPDRTAPAYARALAAIADSDADTVLLPGRVLGPLADATYAADRPVVENVLAHCRAAERMLIIDPPAGYELDSLAALEALALPEDSSAALYYPWVLPTGATTPVAPSGFAAGLWARTDAAAGPWKAPAGAGARLTGAGALEQVVDDAVQAQLNPRGVNALRQLPGRGVVAWGARTLAARSEPEWRYLPVRRTVDHLRRSVGRALDDARGPNDQALWSAAVRSLDLFLDGLWRAGALQGAKPDEAWYARCGRGTTITDADIAAGRLVVEFGVALLRPAEFVLSRLERRLAPA